MGRYFDNGGALDSQTTESQWALNVEEHVFKGLTTTTEIWSKLDSELTILQEKWYATLEETRESHLTFSITQKADVAIPT